MSDIDVLRVLLGVGSSGGDSPAEGNAALLSLLEFPTGKINIDEGRVRPDAAAGTCAALGLGTLEDCLRCDGDRCGRPIREGFGGDDDIGCGDADLGFGDEGGKKVDRRGDGFTYVAEL